MHTKARMIFFVLPELFSPCRTNSASFSKVTESKLTKSLEYACCLTVLDPSTVTVGPEI